MDADDGKQKRRENVISSLNAAIAALDIAEKATSVTPATAAFSIVKEILTVVKVGFPLLCLSISQARTHTGVDGQ